jgi:hypothetical protein
MNRWILIGLILLVGYPFWPVSAQEHVDEIWESTDGVVCVRTSLKREQTEQETEWRSYRLSLAVSVKPERARVRLTLHLPNHAVWWDRARPSVSDGDLDFSLRSDGALVWYIESRDGAPLDLILSLKFSAPGEPTLEVIPETFQETGEPIVYFPVIRSQ